MDFIQKIIYPDTKSININTNVKHLAINISQASDFLLGYQYVNSQDDKAYLVTISGDSFNNDQVYQIGKTGILEFHSDYETDINGQLQSKYLHVNTITFNFPSFVANSGNSIIGTVDYVGEKEEIENGESESN